MKEIQNFAGQIYEAIYLGNVDFKDLNPLWQVYGFFFNGDGKLLINDDEIYTKLISELRDSLKSLAKKIEPKVYEYGFLKK